MSTNLELILRGNIENSILNTLTNSILLSDVAGPLRPVIASFASAFAPQILQTTFNSSNTTLDDINQNMLGPIDPFNLVTGNLGSSGLLNNLLNSVFSTTQNQLVNTGNSLLSSAIRTAFPALFTNTATSILISSLIFSVVRSVVTSQVPIALKGYTDSIFSVRTGPPPTFLGSTVNFEGIFTSDDDGVLATEKLSNALAQKYLQQARNFNIDNESNKEKLIATKLGFIDPEANYPSKEYSGKAETNKLAQGDIRGTIVQEKNISRLKGAKLPGGESFDQPEVPFKGQYPYNKVTETEGGHVIEVDDTPGAERLHVYHTSGSFIELDSVGNMVIRSEGSKYEIINKNGKIAIRGRADVSVAGECRIFVGNDASIEVEGNTNITCHNDTTIQTGGNAYISAAENFFLNAGNVFIESKYDTHIRSNANVFVSSHLQQHYRANTTFNIDGSIAHINSGTSIRALSSKAGLLFDRERQTGRRETPKIELADPVALTLADTLALKCEETESDEVIAFQKDLILKSGFTDKTTYENKPVIIEISPSKNKRPDIVIPNQNVRKATVLPGNYNLSPNFTLEMLTTKSAITKSPIIEEDNGVSLSDGKLIPSTKFTNKFGDVAFNLHALALNILEPAYNIFPNLLIASAYRPASESSPNSIHYTGKAVDIVLDGATRVEVYSIARILEENLRYQNFILEYCSYTKNSWIHIEFDSGSSTKTGPMTFYNSSKLTDGLAKIL